jgi:hypothetical protein
MDGVVDVLIEWGLCSASSGSGGMVGVGKYKRSMRMNIRPTARYLLSKQLNQSVAVPGACYSMLADK